jgi:biopolymer transport protein ExbB/TolQ
MRFKILVIFSIIAFAIQFDAKAQEDAKLSDQYQNMIESSETFEKYKVIPISKVNAFGQIMNDSINELKESVAIAKSARLKAETERDSAKSKMNGLTSELEETQKAVDEMPFLGIPMSKTTYNVVMWSIVVILIAGLVLVYIMFLNSYRLTRQAKKDKELVDQELEDLRKRSHDKQVKIKRELQTALNKLEEQRR